MIGSVRNVQRLAGIALFLVASLSRAEDWPEWRGKGRLGVWNETGTLEKFPEGGLRYVWRTPIKAGYTGPAVAAGRVFVTDFERKSPAGLAGAERAICLDEKTGKVLWTQSWDIDYKGLSYNAGPRATPTVDGDRVYVLGAMGTLLCLNVKDGAVVWRRDYIKDFGTDLPVWGMTGAPLVDGDRLICLAGGEPEAMVVALDKVTGKDVWRAIKGDSEEGYAPPVLIEAGGARQIIQWHAAALTSLEPATGKVLWEQPFEARTGLSVATPVRDGKFLMVSSFYTGSMMLELAADRPGAKRLWQGTSKSELPDQTDGLHALVVTPAIKDGYIYGVCSYGQLRCLEEGTGKRVWESLELTKEKQRWAAAFLVRHGDHFICNNDRGELILADLSPSGYKEISRTKLIEPTTDGGGGRRELKYVNWVHPAYANKHIFTRNDHEIICASLEAR